MRRVRRVVALMAFSFSLGLSVEAMAQSGPVFREPYRRWDIGGGVTLRFGEAADAVVPAGAWTAEFGRYWTSHIKTSIAVMTAGQATENYYESPSRTSREVVTRPTGFGISATYQFLDNEFVHPYVTAGARFASVSILTTVYSAHSPFGVLQSDSSPNRIETRPIFGGGFKSYFGNGRAFMRSELLFAVGPNNQNHAILQVGAGVDF